MIEDIIRFQENMLLIRRTVGWTAEEFGEKIGVTRQTINNLEKNNREKFKLNKTQYIAMRSVLDAEISKCPDETEVLRLILEMLVDHPENYEEDEIKTLLEKANMITPSILAGTATRQAVSKEIMTAMGLMGGAFSVEALGITALPLLAGGIPGTWLFKVLSNNKK